MGMTKGDIIGSTDAAELRERVDKSNISMYRVLLRWLLNRNTCDAAKVMAAVMSGIGYDSHGRVVPHPENIPDIRECLELIDLFPGWETQLGKMASLSPQWRLLVESWPELENLYRAGKNLDCYTRILEATSISPSIRKI